MSKLLANAAIALSLMLPASAASPASAAGTSHSKKCTAANHKHAKPWTVAAKRQPARGVMLVEQRKLDVQVLSFGP